MDIQSGLVDQLLEDLDQVPGLGPFGAVVLETLGDEVVVDGVAHLGVVVPEEGLVEHLLHHLHTAHPLPHRRLSQNLVNQKAQRPNVALRADRRRRQLFRRRVTFRQPYRHRLFGFVVGAQGLAQAEIGQLGTLPIIFQQNVLQFEIAMDEVHVVQVLYSFEDVEDDLVFPGHGDRPVVLEEVVLEVHAHSLHDQDDGHLVLAAAGGYAHQGHQVVTLAQQVAGDLVEEVGRLVVLHLHHLHGHRTLVVRPLVHTPEPPLAQHSLVVHLQPTRVDAEVVVDVPVEGFGLVVKGDAGAVLSLEQQLEGGEGPAHLISPGGHLLRLALVLAVGLVLVDAQQIVDLAPTQTVDGVELENAQEKVPGLGRHTLVGDQFLSDDVFDFVEVELVVEVPLGSVARVVLEDDEVDDESEGPHVVVDVEPHQEELQVLEVVVALFEDVAGPLVLLVEQLQVVERQFDLVVSVQQHLVQGEVAVGSAQVLHLSDSAGDLLDQVFLLFGTEGFALEFVGEPGLDVLADDDVSVEHLVEEDVVDLEQVGVLESALSEDLADVVLVVAQLVRVALHDLQRHQSLLLQVERLEHHRTLPPRRPLQDHVAFHVDFELLDLVQGDHDSICLYKLNSNMSNPLGGGLFQPFSSGPQSQNNLQGQFGGLQPLQPDAAQQQQENQQEQEQIRQKIKEDQLARQTLKNQSSLILQEKSYRRSEQDTNSRLESMLFHFEVAPGLRQATKPVDSSEVKSMRTDQYQPLTEDPSSGIKNILELVEIKKIAAELQLTNQMVLKNMQQDGIYENDEKIQMSEENLHRFQQRFKNNQEYQFWQEDGKVVHERNVLEENLIKISNIRMAENESLQLQSRNAVYSERSNQRKQVFYKLDIVIQKVFFQNHPMFNQEDRMVQELKQLVAIYRSKMDLALIPHLTKSTELLQQEINKLRDFHNPPSAQIELLQKLHDKCQSDLEQETGQTHNLMEAVQSKWVEIKNLRSRQGHTGQPFKLNIREYTSVDQQQELELQLNPTPTTKDRLKAHRQTVRLVISINGFKAAESAWAELAWPNYEVNLQESFGVILYTKPSQVKVEIFKKGLLESKISEFFLEVPGENVDSLTSSELIQGDQHFSYGRLLPSEASPDPSSAPDYLSHFKNTHEYEGKILYKAQWHGFGPHLPPQSLDHKQNSVQQVEHPVASLLPSYSNFLNLNDPRNVRLFEQFQQKYDKQNLQDLFLPFQWQRSFRQQLIQLRINNPQLQKMQLPLKENKISCQAEFLAILEQEFLEEIKNNRLKSDAFPSVIQAHQVGAVEEYPQNQTTLNRIMALKRTLAQRLKQQQLNKVVSHSVRSVVNEFYLGETENPIVLFLRDIFRPRQKLGAHIVSSKKEEVSSLNQIEIICSIINGINVPIRSKAQNEIQQIRRQRNLMSSQLSRSMTATQMPRVSMNLNMSNRFSPESGGGFFNNVGQQMSQVQRQMSQVGRQMSQVGRQMYGQQNMSQNQTMQQMANDDQVNNLERVQAMVTIKLIKEGTLIGVVKSEVSEGSFPEFNSNHSLSLRSLLEDSFSMEEIMNPQNKLVITVFDQLQSMRNALEARNKFILSVEKHYLGSMELPLVALLDSSQMAGQFRLTRPLVLFGYFNVAQNLFSNEAPEQMVDVTNPQLPTLLSLNISLQPKVSLPVQRRNSDFSQGFEKMQFLIMVSKWVEQFNKRGKQFAERNYQVFAHNVEGQSVFLPRFLRPLQPPLEELQSNNILTRLARYVSLVPAKHHQEEFKSLPAFYSDCQQLLDLRGGDIDEHAILLANYFNYIDKNQSSGYQSYLVYGYSIPYGRCAMVLRKTTGSLQVSNTVEIWDPVLGECYSFTQSRQKRRLLCCMTSSSTQIKGIVNQSISCNLMDIGVLVSGDNIYANVQTTASPGSMGWQLDDPKQWQAVLRNDMRANLFQGGVLQSVQPAELVYEQVPGEYAQRLEVHLQNYVMQQIEQQRVHQSEGQLPHGTRFNKSASDRIKTLVIPSLESFRYKVRVSGFSDQSEESRQLNLALNQLVDIKNEFLKEENQGKKIYGFPLNTTFSSKEALWSQIQNTEIDAILKHDMEYIVSVNCFQYPNYIISVWVFVAVLIEDEF